MTISRCVLTLAILAACTQMVLAQQSDFETQQAFEHRATALKTAIDSATTTQQLDGYKSQIGVLALEFESNKDFLDKAMYPSSFNGTIVGLRRAHEVAQARVGAIQTQGIRISELETSMTALTARLDTLSGERAQMFTSLQAAQHDVASLRDAIKRLSANLTANDRLVFALLDSIFLPYDRNFQQSSDATKEGVAGKLMQANVLNRVYDVATDNLKFLGATQLQPKDFASLIEQYQQFRIRWNGLSDKLKDVTLASERRNAASGKQTGSPATTTGNPPTRPADVDSLLRVWNDRLNDSFWSAIQHEFTSQGVSVNQFHDAASFSAAVRALVSNYKDGGGDTQVFVEKVWKERIDREWREALSRETMLGKAEYGALDLAVSELGQKSVDLKLILYIAGFVFLVAVVWWYIARKPKPTVPAPEETPKA